MSTSQWKIEEQFWEYKFCHMKKRMKSFTQFMKLLLKATWVPVCYQNYNISNDTSTVTLESQDTTMNKGKGPTQAYIVNSFELTPLDVLYDVPSYDTFTNIDSFPTQQGYANLVGQSLSWTPNTLQQQQYHPTGEEEALPSQLVHKEDTTVHVCAVKTWRRTLHKDLDAQKL
ncbi:hypothetical protein FRACYDRAFT_254510 [Fragilariopsis cylindrus CCMP1102]|uniref:Uncharacterized protein n=1 Tax=Fragilariopsis cylindrus CCMP1102 TaxID=635003 RepID=A0A1E7EKQ2_9STRA|nr:hypothetical protein FRACYDRAFT_254510 [Fragilariopsis cylindrus CCMP1102]|eukprot:OEU06490.1 hypothetical protein FRACYDRAFT_254510 [Fragilariopsis cylindrus CCMP1102]